MNRRFNYFTTYFLWVIDLIAISFAYQKSMSIISSNDIQNIFSIQKSFIPFIIIWIIVALIFELYDINRIITYNQFFRNTIKSYFFWFTGVLIFQNVHIDNKKEFVFLLFFFVGTILLSIRIIYWVFLYYFKDNKWLKKNIIIIGYNENAIHLSEHLEKEPYYHNIIGFAENVEEVKNTSNYPIICNVADTISTAIQNNVSEIYFTKKECDNQLIGQLIKSSEKACIKFKIVTPVTLHNSTITLLDRLPVLMNHNEAIDDLGNIILKRTIDIVFSFLVLIFILSWMIPLFAIIILIESKGPVFFIQSRTGKYNIPFLCIKFRTMKPNKDADLIQATKNDQRTTKFGRFLRMTSLDEFPQFLNVLMGNMSVVGPRPLMIKHTHEYNKLVEQFMTRHLLKPGITGWAQINGYRGEITDHKQIINRVNFDIWYLDHWSIDLDFKIILLTIYKICKGQKNAYVVIIFLSTLLIW